MDTSAQSREKTNSNKRRKKTRADTSDDPDISDANGDLSALIVVELKERLSALGLDTKGRKAKEEHTLCGYV